MRLRIKFSKYGAMKFIGHLDLMRFFQKAVRRAEINIAYSAGFNPHQLMSFASPLGVGLTSNGEYLDIVINDKDNEIDIEDLQKRLANEMVDGIDIIAISPLSETAGNAMASVAAADYTVIFNEKITLDFDWCSQFATFLQSETIIYTKCTKKVTRDIDLKPLIYKTAIKPENKAIYMLINASSADSIKPQFVIEAFFDYIGQHLPEFAIDICREEIYANTGTMENPNFIPLIDG